MLDSKTQRKLDKCRAHTQAAADAMVDLPDWVLHTDPSGWDADVIRAHAKTLEATGCHLRRLLADLESQNIID